MCVSYVAENSHLLWLYTPAELLTCLWYPACCWSIWRNASASTFTFLHSFCLAFTHMLVVLWRVFPTACPDCHHSELYWFGLVAYNVKCEYEWEGENALSLWGFCCTFQVSHAALWVSVLPSGNFQLRWRSSACKCLYLFSIFSIVPWLLKAVISGLRTYQSPEVKINTAFSGVTETNRAELLASYLDNGPADGYASRAEAFCGNR